MAEAVGVAASALQIADIGVKLSENIYRYVETVANADRRIADIACTIELTTAVIQELGHIFNDNEIVARSKASAVFTARRTLGECECLFKSIGDEIEKCRKYKVLLPFKTSKLEQLNDSLESFKSNLSLLMHVLQHAQQLVTQHELRKETQKLIWQREEATKNLKGKTPECHCDFTYGTAQDPTDYQGAADGISEESSDHNPRNPPSLVLFSSTKKLLTGQAAEVAPLEPVKGSAQAVTTTSVLSDTQKRSSVSNRSIEPTMAAYASQSSSILAAELGSCIESLRKMVLKIEAFQQALQTAAPAAEWAKKNGIVDTYWEMRETLRPVVDICGENDTDNSGKVGDASRLQEASPNQSASQPVPPTNHNHAHESGQNPDACQDVCRGRSDIDLTVRVREPLPNTSEGKESPNQERKPTRGRALLSLKHKVADWYRKRRKNPGFRGSPKNNTISEVIPEPTLEAIPMTVNSHNNALELHVGVHSAFLPEQDTYEDPLDRILRQYCERHEGGPGFSNFEQDCLDCPLHCRLQRPGSSLVPDNPLCDRASLYHLDHSTSQTWDQHSRQPADLAHIGSHLARFLPNMSASRKSLSGRSVSVRSVRMARRSRSIRRSESSRRRGSNRTSFTFSDSGSIHSFSRSSFPSRDLPLLSDPEPPRIPSPLASPTNLNQFSIDDDEPVRPCSESISSSADGIHTASPVHEIASNASLHSGQASLIQSDASIQYRSDMTEGQASTARHLQEKSLLEQPPREDRDEEGVTSEVDELLREWTTVYD